jgi:flagellar hook-basal body complex protein FliE
MSLPIDPSMAVGGTEWQIAPVGPADGADATTGSPESGAGAGFGGMLGDALGSLAKTQVEAAQGAQQLAAGTAQDPTAVVMAVERAQLSMQFASQVRNKLVEASQDIFHTQI